MAMSKSYYIYIVTNFKNDVFYIGVTGNLHKRIYEHKEGLVDGFTKKYKVWKLVYYEETNNINDAIAREKQLKNWHRNWKINLIKEHNPTFREIIVY